MRCRKQRRNGQGILEYILILAVVIAAVVAAAGTLIKPAVKQVLETDTKAALDNAAAKLDGMIK